MQLERVIRLDSIPLDSTYYTEEGYLMDEPIVTTCGIFEYKNKDGSVRRELRLPEDVFAESSLSSYEGKPIIITHNAGAITKNNVSGEQIGTIISKGIRDGDNVRAKIVIHNTDQMLRSGLRELSLGYSLETDDTPGVWNGQPYDCIQRNIEINHLALVKEARAGDTARLNIDGKESEPKGGTNLDDNTMHESGLSPEELDAAIALYKSHKAAEGAGVTDTDSGSAEKDDAQTEDPERAGAAQVSAGIPSEGGQETSPADRIRANMKKLEEDEGGMEQSAVIAQIKEYISALLDECDKLAASKDMSANADSGQNAEPEGETGDEPEKKKNEDGKEVFDMDQIDAMVAEKLDVCRVAEKLNLDGVEEISTMEGKKKVIMAVNPKLNLDGKSETYVDAAYDIAKQSVKERKPVEKQYEHVFGEGGIHHDSAVESSADEKRKNMIETMLGGNE